MRYILLVLGVLILLAASIAVVVRSFQIGVATEVRTEAPPPQLPDPAPEDRIPVAAQAPSLPALTGTPEEPRLHPEEPRPHEEASLPVSPSRVPFRNRLDLTPEEIERVRYVLLTHNIMQLEETDFPLRVGASVPEGVVLTPLPIELAKLVPDYSYYSYAISRNQIAIVVTESREIKLLIPVPAPA